MPDRTCVICAAPLTGRQTKFCSKVCAGRAAYQYQLDTGYRTGRGREKRKAWMDANRAKTNQQAMEERECVRCGQPYQTRYQPQQFCSKECAGVARRVEKPVKPIYVAEAPGPVRQALITQDWSALIEALRSKTTLTDGGCWEWMQQVDGSGYGVIRTLGGKNRKRESAHRVMAMAMTGAAVPSHLPVHHKCANRKCINPDHLQVVQPHENTAEMLERNYYLRRIAELESFATTLLRIIDMEVFDVDPDIRPQGYVTMISAA